MATETLTPTALGLPLKFREFRTYQLEAIRQILASDKRVVLMQAPTGVGKTLVMAALAKVAKEHVLYTCHTKQLQGQVVADFPYAVELKGRRNYLCLKNPGQYPDLTAQECSVGTGNALARACQMCQYASCSARKGAEADKCPCQHGCPYLLQKALAKQAELAILNTPLFLAEANYVGDFSGWPWVVLDEGDLTEQALMGFIQVAVTRRQIENLRLQPPAKKTVATSWVVWADKLAIPAIQARLQALAGAFMPMDLREQKELERLLSKLLFLVSQSLDRWVFIPAEDSWTFKPVFISPYAESRLWRHGKRFLVMSATIINARQFARDLGLKPDDVAFIDMPSPFPPERWPIHYRPVADMTYRNQAVAWPAMVGGIDEVLAAHPTEKGLIHTHSYQLARYICQHSRFAYRLLQHEPNSRVSALESFKASNSPQVLISPSMDRGVDLPGDLCRFLVVAKVPFPHLGDPQIAARLYSARDGDMWYAVQTVRALVQSTGRGMRSPEDYCTNYILDAQFGRLWKEQTGLFPVWWRQALLKAKDGA